MEDFVRARKDEIEKLVQSGHIYAKYLCERTDQVERMQSTDKWSSISKIEVYRGK